VRVVALVLAEHHLDVVRHVVNIWIANVNVERHVADVGVVRRHHVGLRECFNRAQMLILHVASLLAPFVIWTKCQLVIIFEDCVEARASHLNHAETVKGQLGRAVRADETRFHVENIWIEVAEFKVVVGVFLSVEADVDGEDFGRSVWWNDASEGAVPQDLGACYYLIACLVREFATSFVAVMLTIKIISTDDE
jgi:hypothetical protein